MYFAWSRFTGFGGVGIYFSRSTDHGVTWSHPMKLSAGVHDVQFPDISVTGNGHVYVTFRQFADGRQTDAIDYVRSTDHGQTFSGTRKVTGFVPADAADAASPTKAPSAQVADPGSPDDEDASSARDCGDFSNACASGFTFFRRDTQVRATADQSANNDKVYLVYDATKPSTVQDSNTTYQSAGPGKVGRAAIYYTRLNGTTGAHTSPQVIDNETSAQQVFPDISVDQGSMHALWWDSRNQATPYSVQLPIGNDAAGNVYQALDVYSTTRSTSGGTWSTPTRLTDYTSNPNYEQFADRTVPFAGDYLWISSVGSDAYGVWTDWRNTVPGSDPRESTASAGGSSEPSEGADVVQCRTYDASTDTYSSDTCPRVGGIDQDIYGSAAP